MSRRPDLSPSEPLPVAGRHYASAPIGLCVLDRELRYVEINAWLAEINGLSVEAHLGQRIQDVLPELAEQISKPLRSVMETGVPLIGGTAQAVTPAHPGVAHRYRHNYVAIRDGETSVVAVTVAVEDLGPCEAPGPIEPAPQPLTPREAEVLREVGRGSTTREVAERLEVSVRTVDAHRRSLSLKLNISGTAALAEFARRAGLV